MTFQKMITLSSIAFFTLALSALAADQPQPSGSVPTTSSTATTPSSDVQTTDETPTHVGDIAPMPSRSSFNRTYHGYTVEQIRSMPLLARPNRPGHFYGNTVRAIYRLRSGR